MSNYREMLGVLDLAAKTRGGKGVLIAILDSGVPRLERFKDNSDCSRDDFGHSTAVSSILFGGNGISGVCEGADAYFVRVLNSKGYGSAETVSKGILKAISKGVDLINLSLGFARTEDCPKPLEEACQAAERAGIAIICAAGNDGGRVNWPGALKNTICVGSAAENGLKTAFSASGEVDFVAKGENLPVIGLDSQKTYLSGTSFSTALVSGVATLLIARLKGSAVGTSVEAVKAALRGVAKDVDADGWDENTGFGLVGASSYGDQTVNLKTSRSIFGIIVDKIKGFFSTKTRRRDVH